MPPQIVEFVARFMAWARRAKGPLTDPQVEAERAETLLARATASCWVALGIIPFTILIYDGFFFPGQLVKGGVLSAAADALIVLLLVGLRRRVFDRAPWLPFALLAAVICNVTEALNLMLTGGIESDFVFPYHVI